MARIGLDARLCAYRFGGISRYTSALVRAFERLPVLHALTLLHSRKARQRLSTQFCSRSLWTPPHHRWERLALSAELLPYQLDLLHSPDFIAPLRGAKRHIITVHDLSFIHYPETMTAASRKYYNRQIAASVQHADHVLAVSHATKKDIIELLGVPAEKITVQHNGVEKRFQPLPPRKSAPIVAGLGLPSQYLLFLGTLEPRKNLGNLARAYRDLRADISDLPPLLLLGKPGWHFGPLMEELRSIGLGDSLLIVHDFPDAALPALYSQAECLLMPSTHEGFGLPALEAMACGTVPIVSHDAALAEVVGDVGLLVDPRAPETIAAAMQRVLFDSAWRAQQSAAGLRRAAQFRWRKSARIALDCYDAVLQQA